MKFAIEAVYSSGCGTCGSKRKSVKVWRRAGGRSRSRCDCDYLGSQVGGGGMAGIILT